MPDYLPKHESGRPFTLTTSADVIGGRVLTVSGANTCAHAGADAVAATLIGVAGFDAASGEKVTVYPLDGAVHKLVAGAAIAAGAAIGTLAGGKVDDAGTNRFAVALTAAAADGDIITAIS
ncbi:capsid cement protein [Microbacterium sp.]|uniref:capsid cement protein n=1 Tax=Microbacterium sp. TaxID=51671 RepID=UPI003F70BEFB